MVTHSHSQWPALTTEPRPWKRDHDQERTVSRRQRTGAQGDYHAAVVPLIADVALVLDSDILAAADDASRVLTRFDAEAGSIPAPFTSILLRTESASSSEIEHITSSAKQVALAELNMSDSINANLVVANVRAMTAAINLADELNEATIITMQEALLNDTAPSYTGKFREEQVWIGGGSISPHNAMFVPPHSDRVPELMADLTRFCARTDIPVLAHAAIAHAQFETIHPFPDGNGRTGRALIHAMLRHGGVTTNLTVPVSAGLRADTNAYFAALTAYRAGNPTPIVTAVTDAAFAAIDNANTLVRQLNEVREDWAELITPRAKSTGSKLFELLLQHPVVNTKLVATELRVSEVAAQNAIDAFVEAGILAKTNNRRRGRIWHAPDVLDTLEEFGNRARRGRHRCPPPPPRSSARKECSDSISRIIANSGRMEPVSSVVLFVVCVAAGCYVLYWVIRTAVSDSLRESRNADQSPDQESRSAHHIATGER